MKVSQQMHTPTNNEHKQNTHKKQISHAELHRMKGNSDK